MKLDIKLWTGIFIGLLLGLHYYSLLSLYLPIVMIATLILVLKWIEG